MNIRSRKNFHYSVLSFQLAVIIFHSIDRELLIKKRESSGLRDKEEKENIVNSEPFTI